ncbi:unnamed protein product [Sphagnum balticum]
MALHKDNAIAGWRELIGATDSKKAAPGTVRNIYGTDLGKNAVHGSADSASALKELELFFPDLFGYGSDDDSDEDDECSEDECSDEDECCKSE